MSQFLADFHFRHSGCKAGRSCPPFLRIFSRSGEQCLMMSNWKYQHTDSLKSPCDFFFVLYAQTHSDQACPYRILKKKCLTLWRKYSWITHTRLFGDHRNVYCFFPAMKIDLLVRSSHDYIFNHLQAPPFPFTPSPSFSLLCVHAHMCLHVCK